MRLAYAHESVTYVPGLVVTHVPGCTTQGDPLMTESIRVFVAIELSDQVRNALSDLVGDLRRAHIQGLRAVDPQGIHLTLKFLGNVSEARIEPIVSDVSRVVSEHRSFSVALDGVGVFPSKTRPRVLWVGLGGDLPALQELHQGVEAALYGLGFAREKREFSPHLTVGRIHDGAPASDRHRAAEALFAAPLDSNAQTEVDSVSLIRSILLPQGAKYQRIAHMPLAGSGLP